MILTMLPQLGESMHCRGRFSRRHPIQTRGAQLFERVGESIQEPRQAGILWLYTTNSSSIHTTIQLCVRFATLSLLDASQLRQQSRTIDVIERCMRSHGQIQEPVPVVTFSKIYDM